MRGEHLPVTIDAKQWHPLETIVFNEKHRFLHSRVEFIDVNHVIPVTNPHRDVGGQREYKDFGYDRIMTAGSGVVGDFDKGIPFIKAVVHRENFAQLHVFPDT
jgi:hypothetical protein